VAHQSVILCQPSNVPQEREEIAEAPIEQAMKNYRETRNTLIVVYAGLILAFVAAGAHTICQENSSSPGAAVSVWPAIDE
jgi:hypothetical protein